jgi:hypothetical protein
MKDFFALIDRLAAGCSLNDNHNHKKSHKCGKHNHRAEEDKPKPTENGVEGTALARSLLRLCMPVIQLTRCALCPAEKTGADNCPTPEAKATGDHPVISPLLCVA